MRREQRYYISIAVSLVMLPLLVWLTIAMPPGPVGLLPMIFFGILVVFTMTFGVPLAGGSVSLLPMTTMAAYLVLGLAPAGWAAFVGAVAHGVVRQLWAEQLEGRRETDSLKLIGLAAANSTMHTGSILAAGAVFLSLGGVTPLTAIDASSFLSLLLFGLVYLAVNYLIAGVYIAARGRGLLQRYLRSLPNLILYEGGPLLFAPLTALIYTRLGAVAFVLFACAIVASSLIARDLALTGRRLERRVQELDGLQAVGRALSASLRIETIVSAIYEQVAQLMQAHNFYVALYDPEVDEVSFPLAVDGGERVQWQSRRMGEGLTEHILRTRTPLLIRRDVEAALGQLGIDAIGRAAACWLGVPILAGDEPLGIIAVQSYTTPEAYDTSHQEVLVTIAAQAGVAIQNARLYARTDEALARRVQELDSILRTTREGMLLLDTGWRVLAANRALADFVGVAQSELTDARSDNQLPVARVGYTLDTLRSDCQVLSSGEQACKQEIIVLGPSDRHIERTLAPVRDREGEIAGWLLVFRDITEEVELARLKDDMTHMLVHDLRSPLTVLDGSLHFMEIAFAEQEADDFYRMLEMARRSDDRMLGMVNELLDISKLESGELSLNLEAVNVRSLLEDVAMRFSTLATSVQISLEISADDDLPPLYVDPQLVGRLLHNLLDNGIKFTPDGGHVRLWARLDPQFASDYLLIGVSDTGPGVPPEEWPQLFEKFQQVASIEGRRAGTGLGLPFCKLVAEAHGGKIWVESEVGEGSTFIAMLPVVK